MLCKVLEYCKKDGFKYDVNSEIKGYNGGVKDFYDAKDTHTRLASLIKCEFLRLSTQMKLAYNGKKQELPFDKVVEQMMVSILLEEIPKGIFDSTIRECEKIIYLENTGGIFESNTIKIKEILIANLSVYEASETKKDDLATTA